MSAASVPALGRSALRTVTIAVPVTADATVREALPNDNFGAEPTLEAGTIVDPVGGHQFTSAFVRFDDLSAIPAGATIVSARLELTEIDGLGDDPLPIWACRAEGNWRETTSGQGPGITWNNQPWRTSLTPCVRADVSMQHVAHTWDVTAIVAEWVAGGHANQGLSLSTPEDVVGRRTFASLERSAGGTPRLLVDYALGGGITGAVATGRGCGPGAVFAIGENLGGAFVVRGGGTVRARLWVSGPGGQAAFQDGMYADGQQVAITLRTDATDAGVTTITLQWRDGGAWRDLATCAFTVLGAAPPTWTPSPTPSATRTPTPSATPSPTLTPTATTVPGPTDLTCAASTDAIGIRIDLDWSLPPGRSRTHVERLDAAGGAWREIHVTAEGVRTYADRGLEPERVFRYRVRAESLPDGTLSPYSAETTCSSRPRPLAPVDLACEAFDEGDAWTIHLGWRNLAPDGIQTQIERVLDGAGPWRVMAIAVTGDTTFDDFDVVPGHGYDYRVVARRLDDGATSAPSEPVTCTTYPRPPAPTALTCSAERRAPAEGGWTFALAWQDHAEDETAYQVERAQANGAFRTIASLDADTTSFALTGNEDGRTSTFRVRAVRDDPAQLSAPSNTASCRSTLPALPVVFVPGFGGSVLESCESMVFAAPGRSESILDWLGRQLKLETWLARALQAAYLADGVVCSEYSAPCVFPIARGEHLWLGSRGIVMAMLGMDRYFDALRLNPDGRTARPGLHDTAACVTVAPGRAGLLAREPTIGVEGLSAGGADIYTGLLRALENALGLEDERTLFVFPYDFRKEIGPTAEALSDLVRRAAAASPNGQVDLVAHSMGGLVARNYLLTHPDDAPLVRQLVTLGTPYLGAPKAIVGLLAGDNFGIQSNDSAILELAPEEMRMLGRDWPGVYTLLPSTEYYRDPERPGWQRAYYMESIETPAHSTHDVYDHERFEDLVDRALNASIAAEVRARMALGIGDMTRMTDRVTTQQIIGSGVPTIHTVERLFLHRCLAGGTCFSYWGYRPWLQRAGDGTVPEVSACGSRHLYQAARGRIHKLPGIDHADLARSDQALAAMVAVLEGHDVAGEVQEDCPQTGVDGATGVVSVDLLGDAAMAVTDASGRVAGATGDRFDAWRDEVPGVRVERLPGASTAFIGEPGAYTVTVRGVASSVVTLRVGVPDATGAALAKAWTFETVGITTTSVATLSLTLDAEGAPTVSPLVLDVAPGRPPRAYPPYGPFTGPAANDIQAPRTTIAVDAAGLVTLTADDGADGTGVAEILYAVATAPHALVRYDRPFPIPAGAFVTAVAIDRAGNAEWPPATTVRGRVHLPWASRSPAP